MTIHKPSGRILAVFNHGRFGKPLRFLGTAGLSMCLTFSVTVGLHRLLHVDPAGAGAVALFAAFCFNFVMMRNVVFAAGGSYLRQLVRFAGTGAVFRMAEWIVYVALIERLAANYIGAMFVTLAVSTALKFFVYRIWVFRSSG